MLDKILYYYCNGNYLRCLEYSEEYLNQDPKNALEYAMLSAYKLGDNIKTLYYSEQIFNLYPTSFYGLMLSKSLLINLCFRKRFNHVI